MSVPSNFLVDQEGVADVEAAPDLPLFPLGLKRFFFESPFEASPAAVDLS